MCLRSRDARFEDFEAQLDLSAAAPSGAGRLAGRALASREMALQPYRVTVDRHQVLVFRDELLVGTGRWTGRAIEDLRPPLMPEAPAEEAALLASLGQALAEEEAAAIASLNAGACNAEGVDLTLIDWILRMTPRERFDVLESYTGIPYRRILETLGRHQVELVIVGGVLFAGGSGGRNGLARLGSLAVSESEYASAVAGKIGADGTPAWFRSFPQFAVNRSTCEADSIAEDDTGVYLAGLMSFSIQFGGFQLQNPSPSPLNWIGKLDAGGEPKWIRAAGGQPYQGAPIAAAGGRRRSLPSPEVEEAFRHAVALLRDGLAP